MRLYKHFLLGLLSIVIIGSAIPARVQAQLGDLFMEDGDARLVFLAPDQDQVLIRISITEPQTLWFGINSTPPMQFLPDVQNQAGERVVFTSIPSGVEGGQLIQVEASSAGDYFLLLKTTPESAAGYVRVIYKLTQPTVVSHSDASTPMGEPMAVAFAESFDDNSANWFVGQIKNSTTSISDGVMLMQVEAGGQAFSGFNVVPGSEQSFYYYTAQVTLGEGDEAGVFGLMFRLVDAANYYLFQVTPQQGQWRFLVLSEGQWTKPFGWHDDSRMLAATGTHEIGVWVMESLFIFTWDGQIVGHVSDTEHVKGGVGLFAEVAPEASGTTAFTWDNVQIGIIPLDGRWGRPSLPGALLLSPEAGIIFAGDSPVNLSQDLVGRWSWNDEANTQQMVIVFMENGDYLQTITDLASGASLQEQTGRWSLRDGERLVLTTAGLPDQQYTPVIDSSKLLLTLPELSNRVFIRVVETNE